MNNERSRPLFNFYVDDSGTGHPDHAPPVGAPGDWFGLGGILIKEEDEAELRESHRLFCEKRNLNKPLHSTEIRHRSAAFAWLASASQAQVREFFADLDVLVSEAPVVGTACVIDRPGYHQRYFERYGRERWKLCKTAFSIICERAAKYAAKQDRRVRLLVEETDKKSDRLIRSYFESLRREGLPFAQNTSGKYRPMKPEELEWRLLDLKFKRKSSPPLQVADLYLYPICRSGYDKLYRPMKVLSAKGRLISNQLTDEEAAEFGLKFSCFD